MTEKSPTGPEHGARLLVLLRADERRAGSATYALSLAVADSTWETAAVVDEPDGRVELETWSGGEAPPPWLLQAGHALLRAAWQRKRAGHPWPRRLARWRPVPDGIEA